MMMTTIYYELLEYLDLYLPWILICISSIILISLLLKSTTIGCLSLIIIIAVLNDTVISQFLQTNYCKTDNRCIQWVKKYHQSSNELSAANFDRYICKQYGWRCTDDILGTIPSLSARSPFTIQLNVKVLSDYLKLRGMSYNNKNMVNLYLKLVPDEKILLVHNLMIIKTKVDVKTFIISLKWPESKAPLNDGYYRFQICINTPGNVVWQSKRKYVGPSFPVLGDQRDLLTPRNDMIRHQYSLSAVPVSNSMRNNEYERVRVSLYVPELDEMEEEDDDFKASLARFTGYSEPLEGMKKFFILSKSKPKLRYFIVRDHDQNHNFKDFTVHGSFYAFVQSTPGHEERIDIYRTDDMYSRQLIGSPRILGSRISHPWKYMESFYVEPGFFKFMHRQYAVFELPPHIEAQSPFSVNINITALYELRNDSLMLNESYNLLIRIEHCHDRLLVDGYAVQSIQTNPVQYGQVRMEWSAFRTPQRDGCHRFHVYLLNSRQELYRSRPFWVTAPLDVQNTYDETQLGVHTDNFTLYVYDASGSNISEKATESHMVVELEVLPTDLQFSARVETNLKKFGKFEVYNKKLNNEMEKFYILQRINPTRYFIHRAIDSNGIHFEPKKEGFWLRGTFYAYTREASGHRERIDIYETTAPCEYTNKTGKCRRQLFGVLTHMKKSGMPKHPWKYIDSFFAKDPQIKKGSNDVIDAFTDRTKLIGQKSAKIVIKKAVEYLNSILWERDMEIKLMLLAGIAGENIALIGPPGTGKSFLSTRVCKIFDVPKHLLFEYLMSEYTVPKELFGMYSIKELKNDKLTRMMSGFLPTVEVAFLDEIFKANSGILNALLTLLNEKRFTNGADTFDVPLLFTIGASNELPKSIFMRALVDRFLFIQFTEPIQLQDNFIRMNKLSSKTNELKGNVPKMPLIPLTRLMQTKLRDISKTIQFRNATTVYLLKLWKLNDNLYRSSTGDDEERSAWKISDRRWQKIQKMLRIAAVTDGRSYVTMADLWLLESTMALTVETMKKLKEDLVNLINEYHKELESPCNNDQICKDKRDVYLCVIKDHVWLPKKIRKKVLDRFSEHVKSLDDKRCKLLLSNLGTGHKGKTTTEESCAINCNQEKCNNVNICKQKQLV